MPPIAGKPFQINGADGQGIAVPAGEYYFNSKARARRMMFNSLGAEARRIYSCLELATMGFQQELAVVMEGGKKRNLRPSDIASQTGLKKQKVSRGLTELEDAGLAKRQGLDGKGRPVANKVEIFSWAVPRPAQKKISTPRWVLPPWFPDSWKPLTPLINRFKLRLSIDEVPARGYFAEGEVVARDYQKAEEVAARFLKRVCAAAKTGPHIERTEITSERTPPPQPLPSGVEPEKADEEDAGYSTFKKLYPQNRFDDAKAKAAFAKLPEAERRKAIAGLRVHLDSERWKRSLSDNKGRFVPLASKFLDEQYAADPPPYFEAPGKAKAMTAGGSDTVHSPKTEGKPSFTDRLKAEAARRLKRYGKI